jgi:predicted SprT family Zn-dependent metalloprotease
MTDQQLTTTESEIEALRRRIIPWSKKWHIPGLEENIQIEFSARLRTSLGRTLPARRVVRLNQLLLLPENHSLLPEVLCHEVAHIATYELHGPECRPHGPEWESLVHAAGYPARLRVGLASDKGKKRTPTSQNVVYEYRCPVCQAVRYARRTNRRWLCAECVASGQPGTLVVTSHPAKKG